MRKLEGMYLGKLVRLGCVRCRYECEQCGWDYTPPDPSLQETVIHHLRAWEGGAQRAENWLAVPLCVACHTGSHGVHGDKLLLRQFKLDEGDLLCLTLRYYHETYGV
jgi:hypothetical protein